MAYQFDKTCKAFEGTPMGYWLRENPDARAYERYVSEQFEEYVRENTIPESCCQDPEYCTDAVCVVCPNCGSNKTIRTTEPDKDNVSEFECKDCLIFFDAMNP